MAPFDQGFSHWPHPTTFYGSSKHRRYSHDGIVQFQHRLGSSRSSRCADWVAHKPVRSSQENPVLFLFIPTPLQKQLYIRAKQESTGPFLLFTFSSLITFPPHLPFFSPDELYVDRLTNPRHTYISFFFGDIDCHRTCSLFSTQAKNNTAIMVSKNLLVFLVTAGLAALAPSVEARSTNSVGARQV